MHAAVLSNVDTIPRIQCFINTFPLKNVCFSSFLWVLIDFRAKRIIFQLNPPSSEQYFGWFSYLPKGAKNLVINLYPIKYPMMFNSMFFCYPMIFHSFPFLHISFMNPTRWNISLYFITVYPILFQYVYIYIYPHHGSLINRDLFMVDIPMCTYVSWLHPVFFHGFAWVKSYFSHDFPWLHHVTSSLPKQVDASPLRPNSTGPFSQ